MKAVGPGVIVLGVSIGSGEFLLGPAVFVRHGLSLLWVAGVAVYFQTIFNTELMRYTLATGEPVFTGFMRTRPSSTFWAWVYSILYFLQVGWPAMGGSGGGRDLLSVHAAACRRGRRQHVYLIGVATFLVCVAILTFGRRIERTLELLNWVLVAAILGSFLVLARDLRAGRHLGGRRGGAGRIRPDDAGPSTSSRPASTCSCSPRWPRMRAPAASPTSCSRTGRATAATA